MTAPAAVHLSASPAARARRAPRNRTGPLFVAIVFLTQASALIIGFRASVILLAGIGFGSALLGLRRPRLGLLGIGLLCTLDPLANAFIFTGGVLRWNTFNYWLLLVAILWTPLLLRRNDVPMRIVQAFALLLAMEVLISGSRATGVQSVLEISCVLGLFVYCSRRRFARADWYWMGVTCGTLAVVGGLLFFFLQQAELARINPNGWAFTPLTALFALCIALPCSYDRWRGPAIITSLASVCLAWIFLSGSRGVMLTALPCGVYLVLGVPGLRRRMVFLLVAALVMMGAGTQFTDLQKNALERVNLLFDSETAMVDRTSKRSELALNGWYLFRERPLGVGTGGFAAALGSMGLREHISTAGPLHARPAHAGWIKVLVENGAPGFLLLASFVASFAVLGLRRPTRGMRALGILTSVALAFAFVTTEYQGKGIWFLSAATLAMLGRGSPLWPQRPVRL